MSSVKISELPSATALDGTEQIPAVQSSTTKKALVSQIGTYVRGLFITTPATVPEGGTGRATLTAKNILLGNGVGTLNFLAPGTSGNVAVSNGTDWTSGAVPVPAYASAVKDLVSCVHADVDTAHRDVLKGAYCPGWFNQQWGGGVNGYELVDAATGTPYKFESATGNIEQNTTVSIADAAGRTGDAMGFKVSKSNSYPAIWVKLAKVGNPSNNLQLRIQADNGSGKPTANFTAITNGDATAISGKLFESGDTAGAWVRFVFATPPALTAGTQYHWTVKSSGAVDASNYWIVMDTTSNKYPHGYLNQADATPTWTSFTSQALCFLVEAPATTQTFQSGGIFGDGKAVFYEGSPLNQSNQRRADLADLKGLNMGSMTALFRGTAHTKDKTIADFTYGLDHDRIVLRCNITTGFPSVNLYDSGGTLRTVTGTTDISSGDHDVAIKVIANTGSGTDKLELWVDGASQGTAITGVAITFDELFRQGQIGSLWIGGGFALAPTWSGSSISSFTGLPSTLGWTWTGAATEANAMSVSGGKLYQNKAGYTALQDGYYIKSTAGLSNANGHNTLVKLRIASNTNTKDASACQIVPYDGAKTFTSSLQEYYFGVTNLATSAYPQVDLKTTDTVFNVIGKGSDAFVFNNGKLMVDGTGLNTGATAGNEIDIGDRSTTSGEQADVVHSYWKYYNTAALLPQATAGSLSEWAIWTGDKTSILATLWNSGSPISVKQFCGLGVNWKRGDDGAWVHTVTKRGVTQTPTAGTTFVALPEMDSFHLGDEMTLTFDETRRDDTYPAYCGVQPYVDGRSANEAGATYYRSLASAFATAETEYGFSFRRKLYWGLHKTNLLHKSSSVTTYSLQANRELTIKGQL